MRISYSWLKQYITTYLNPIELGDILTEIGLETEKIHEVNRVPNGLKGVLVGEVLECERHPNADRLQCTIVSIGNDINLSIVCGAPNVQKGLKVAVSTIGTTLYPTKGEPFSIKKGKIRGEVSEGMICAEDELGLGESHDGIMVLDSTLKAGTPLAEALGLESDYCLEIGLTPNRSDAMSHYGVARDLNAALKFRGLKSELSLPSIQNFTISKPTHRIQLEILDSDACQRYFGIVLDGIKIAPSPDWLIEKLQSIDIKPINNVVDITNYVLHETGHPLHAFDLKAIKGNIIKVRRANENEEFETLDGKLRKLDPMDLMICNESDPMSIAGVFGGSKSGVNENTTAIFLESALFNPVRIRKTAKRHGLNTDASFRYERGVDPEMSLYALQRAALLLQEVAGAYIASELFEAGKTPSEPKEISVSYQRMNQLIGHTIDTSDYKLILGLLDIRVLAEINDILHLKPPAYRVDVTREADIVEEVLRIYGLNNIPFPKKIGISTGKFDAYPAYQKKEKVANALTASGVQEVMHNSLHKESYYNPDDLIRTLNPLSQDLNVLRNSPLPNGLETIRRNLNQKVNDLCFYEFGRTYHLTEKGYDEKEFLALWQSGLGTQENWNSNSKAEDIFFLKSKVEEAFSALGLDRFEQRMNGTSLEWWSSNKKMGTLQKLENKLLKSWDIDQSVYYAELDWDLLLKRALKVKIKTSEIPKYPAARRDLALLVPKEVPFESIQLIVQRSAKKLLKEFGLFDVYEGKNLPDNTVSYAVKLIFQDSSKTLTDNEVEKIINQVLKQLEKELSIVLRA